MPDPKAALEKAQTKLALAHDALTEPEKIARDKKLLDADHKKLADTIDLADKSQLRQLTDLTTQQLVIPRQLERATERQTEVGLLLIETSENLRCTIAELLQQEVNKRLDEWEKKLLPDCPDYTESNGAVIKRARGLAGALPIFYHIGKRATPATTDAAVCDPSRCHNEPEKALRDIVAHVEEQISILANYFSAGRTFRSPDFDKAA